VTTRPPIRFGTTDVPLQDEPKGFPQLGDEVGWEGFGENNNAVFPEMRRQCVVGRVSRREAQGR
jgi:hypothetical protein